MQHQYKLVYWVTLVMSLLILRQVCHVQIALTMGKIGLDIS